MWLLLLKPVKAAQDFRSLDMGDLLVWLLFLGPGWAAQAAAFPLAGVSSMCSCCSLYGSNLLVQVLLLR